MLSIATMFSLTACGTSSKSNVSEIAPESVLPIVPSGVPRGEGELVETRDLFHGKPVVILIETSPGQVMRDYLAEREVALSAKPIREQGSFLVFDSIGEAYKRPDGFVYATTASVRSKQLSWLVSCVRWKPKWASGHGCVLSGQNDGKYYEVDMEEAELPIAEDLNAFVLTHL